MSATAGAVELVSLRLPGPVWQALDAAVAQRGTCREEVLCRIIDGWAAAGAPDPGVPRQLVSAGLASAEEVGVYRALIWWLGRPSPELDPPKQAH